MYFYLMMLRLRLLFICFIFSIATAIGQAPVITGISSTKGTVNTVLEITGSGFGTDIGTIKVGFGAAYGNVISVDNNVIKVQIPGGTTVENITVTNTSSGLSGFSSVPFMLSFGGLGLNDESFKNEISFSANPGLTEHCLCDLDNDGKVDAVTTTSDLVNSSLSIFKNESVIGTTSFSKTNVSVNAPTLSIACGDLDGDGKKDLVAVKIGGSGDQVYVMRNTTVGANISFTPPVPYFSTGDIIKKVFLKDLNKDGKIDILTSSESANVLSIFKNTSTVGNVVFEFTPINISVAGASSTSFIISEDLNQDGLPEIIANSYLGHQIFFLNNISTSSTIAFSAAQVVSVKSGTNNLISSDINSDGIYDLVFTNYSSAEVGVLINTTANGSPTASFEDPVYFAATAGAWGIDAGDLDGDGKVDLAVSTTNNSKLVSLLRNTSTAGAISFDNTLVTTTEKSKSVKIADFNGDGKPDLSFSGIDNSRFIITKNNTCIEPIVTSNTSLAICKNTLLRLQVPQGIGLSYQWKKEEIDIIGKNEYFLDVTESGSYSAELKETYSSCVKTSEKSIVKIFDPESTEPQIAIFSDGITEFCEGDSVKLEVQGDFISYSWNNGKNGKTFFAKTGGNYSVDIEIEGGCKIKEQITLIANAGVRLTVEADKTQIKPGETVRLNASGADVYLWENHSTINDPTIFNPSVTPTVTTTYKVNGIDSNGCEGSTEITIEVIEEITTLRPHKTFTPNNDGIDEFWVIENIRNYSNYTVSIFSRSGKKIFEATPYANNWDGTSAGEKLARGDYYYVIKDNNSGKSQTGSFMLIR